MTDPKPLISDLLHCGRDAPTSARELSQLLGWKLRTVTRAIEAERRQGVPILASGDGYFLPGNDSELDDYLGALAHRESEIKRTRAAIAQTRQQTMSLREA